MKNDVRTEVVTYASGGVTFKGFVAIPQTVEKAPGVVIAHAWRGLDEFARKKAVALAELGYIALAADLYGGGVTAANNEEAAALMLPLFVDRQLLRQRIIAAVETLRKNPFVDQDRIGAIGFCFGGLTVIELLRSGAAIRGAVSFHGVLGKRIGNNIASETAIAPGVTGRLLILHGYDDPLVSASDLAAIQKELTEAKIDWQLVIYGHTSHAFTNPEANEKELGLIYNPTAERRSWQSMRNFFEEVFA